MALIATFFIIDNENVEPNNTYNNKISEKKILVPQDKKMQKDRRIGKSIKKEVKIQNRNAAKTNSGMSINTCCQIVMTFISIVILCRSYVLMLIYQL